MKDGFTLAEVAKLLGLSRSMLGRLIDAGFVIPGRGPRGAFRFTFHDLVVLRTAQGLLEARLSSTRILRALRRLRAQLPDQVPLSGLRIEAVGDAVVVNEGMAQWQPDNGQYILRFQVESPEGRVSFFDPSKPSSAPSAGHWFAKGLALEASNADEACAAYRCALAVDQTHVSACINLGQLLHAQGHLKAAEDAYRAGLLQNDTDATLLFNLAVLMEDMHQINKAEDFYCSALKHSPAMADAHYNLALLYDAQGMQQKAVRHLSAFRRLSNGGV